jgi:DNA-binding GntR family transcriptional regulator
MTVLNLPQPVLPMVEQAVSSKSTTSLAQQAVESIKDLIFNFDLIPGERFSEADLTQRLNISRTPLRQALQQLEQQGFLQVLPKMGWFVAPIDFEAIDELYDLRILLEINAIGDIVDQGKTELLEPLAKFWIKEDGEYSTDGKSVGTQDEIFHFSIVASAGNKEILKIYQQITDRIRLIRRLDFKKSQRIEVTYKEHAAILNAIRSKRKAEAQRLIKAHISQSKIEARKITLDELYKAKSRSLELEKII